MRIRSAALLDLDGTLMDSAPGIIAGFHHAYNAIGLMPPDDATLRSWIGPPVLQTLEKELAERGPGAVATANEAFRQYFDETGADEVAPFDGIPDALASLASSIDAVVVVTHKPLPLAQRAIALNGLGEFVWDIHAPQSPSDPIPKSSLFRDALARAQPASAISAGDRAGDVRAALANQLPTVGVRWGYGSDAELREAGAIAIARSPSELPSLLMRHLQECTDGSPGQH